MVRSILPLTLVRLVQQRTKDSDETYEKTPEYISWKELYHFTLRFDVSFQGINFLYCFLNEVNLNKLLIFKQMSSLSCCACVLVKRLYFVLCRIFIMLRVRNLTFLGASFT